MTPHDPATPVVKPSSRVSAPRSVLRGSTTTLIDQAYEEYCTRTEAGEQIETGEFLLRYPTIQSSLGRLIELHHEFEAEALREASVVWPMAGDFFHGYQLEQHLGDGASSRVFLARERALGDRQVAVKITRQADAEAYTLGRINHPNVIGIHSRPSVPGQDLAIICMEYEGSATLCCLLDLVLNCESTPKEAKVIFDAARDPFAEDPVTTVPARWVGKSYETGIREFFGEVCSALEYLHVRKILHRDLKPSNILMRQDGSPVLLDFNLARDPKSPGSRFGGTYQYMPPEQLIAMSGVNETLSNAVDERSDLFAVGVLLWECLTGKLPFGKLPKDSTVAEYLALQEEGFKAPMPDGWSVSPELVALVRRCLSSDPTQRPASAAELRRLLVPAEKKQRKGLWAWAATAAVVGGIAIATAAGLFSRTPAPAAAPVAAPVVNEAKRNDDIAKQYNLGVEAWKKGDMAVALNQFNLVVRERPESSRALRARAVATVKEETTDKKAIKRALDDVNAADGLDGSVANFAYKAFLRQMQAGVQANTEAVGSYLKALRDNVSPAASLNNLSVMYSGSTGTIEDAISYAVKAVDAEPKSPQPHFNLAYARYKKSVDAFQNTLTDEQKVEQNRLRNSAIADYLKALELTPKGQPESGEIHYRLAGVMATTDPVDPRWNVHLKKAIELGFAESLAVNPEFKAVRGSDTFAQLEKVHYPGYLPQSKMKRLIPPHVEPPKWE